jgi:hypothetical protein
MRFSIPGPIRLAGEIGEELAISKDVPSERVCCGLDCSDWFTKGPPLTSAAVMEESDDEELL